MYKNVIIATDAAAAIAQMFLKMILAMILMRWW